METAGSCQHSKRRRSEPAAGERRRRRREGTQGREAAATAKMLTSWDIKYLSDCGSLLRVGPVWTQQKCRRCIELCEEHGAWSSNESAVYPFATCDVEVDQVGERGREERENTHTHTHTHRQRVIQRQ